MRNRLTRRVFSLLTALGLLASLALPAVLAADPEEEAVSISSVEELRAFAKNCSLDAWSQGKTFLLKADLNLAGEDFTPIPIFGGTFDGQGHTISGLRITAAGSGMGLFRYIEAGALVENLRVEGLSAPEGTRSTVGGIAGVNNGTIQNCAFQGSVQGKASVGGIAGLNGKTGQITACSSAGFLYGENATGGIAGRNLGLLLKCENTAGVNLTEAEASVNLMDLDVQAALEERITAAEGEDAGGLLSSCTDTGGIVGYSSGVVQSCVNSGNVGYPHVGYNTGGIAGRQSGYLAGCVNSGVIHGRKDVGGIVGQSEPLLALNPGQDSLERIRRELDTLDTLINRALDDAQSTGDGVSARLTAMGDYTDNAKDHAQDLLDRTSDFLDENIDTINTVSADITNALDRIAPALDDLADAGGRLERLSRSLGNAMAALGDAVDIGDGAMADVRAAVERLRQSGGSLSEAAKALSDALEALLRDVAGGSGGTEAAALAQAKTALRAMDTALSSAAEGVAQLKTALSEADPLPGTGEALPALGDLSEALGDLAGGLGNAGTALPASPEDWEAAKTALRKAGQSLSASADALAGAMTDLHNALSNASPLSGKLGSALRQLEDASSSASVIGRLLSGAFQTISGAVEDLTGDGPAAFTPLGEGFRESSDGLYDALSGLTGEMDSLNELLQDSGDTISADLRAVSRQFNAVFDAVLDAMEELRDGEPDRELIEDTSDQDISATREGKITACRNSGPVDGDRNVGGVVGSMSIELDTDPEENADRRFSFGSTYETKAVLENCVNRGQITAKKDCAGGLAGRMDLGTALGCENYGPVESTGGDYVGGVAGLADGTVRSCFSKCALSGKNYIGGIAGWASRLRDCYAIATITQGTEALGAIAGGMDEDGVLSGSRFVDTGTAGVDGVSYAGRAEPIAFADLRDLPGIPTEFTAFTLTLVAGEKTVAQIPFYYGDDLSKINLPAVPDSPEGYGVWPEFDTSGAKSDITVEAVYAPWITLAPSQELEGKQPLALVEGKFTEEAVLHAVDSAQSPPAEAGTEAVVRHVTLSGADLGPSDEIPLRLLTPGGGNAQVWRLTAGGWEKVDAERSGSYLLLTMTGTEGDFCLQPQSQSLLWLLPIGAAALAAFLLIGKGIKRRKSRPKAPKPDKKKAEEQTPSPAGK